MITGQAKSLFFTLHACLALKQKSWCVKAPFIIRNKNIFHYKYVHLRCTMPATISNQIKSAMLLMDCCPRWEETAVVQDSHAHVSINAYNPVWGSGSSDADSNVNYSRPLMSMNIIKTDCTWIHCFLENIVKAIKKTVQECMLKQFVMSVKYYSEVS